MTMELIAHQELGSAAANITFSSIPQTYTDLMLLISPQITAQNYVFVNVNGSSANHTFRNLINELGTVDSYTESAYGVNAFPVGPMFSQNGSIPSNVAVYFPNYTSSNAKTVTADFVSEANSANVIGGILAGLWNNTAAITSLVLALSTGNIGAGSSATLYGIRRFNTTLSPKATGGAISYDSVNNKWVHAFYTSGTFTPTENLSGVEYLVVAGGGAGGNSGSGSGGGGAGGYRSSVVGESSGGGASAESTLSLTSGTNYTVTIGAGGSAGGNQTNGSPGSDSVFGSITATGGGFGAADSTNGGNGGSGGGAGGVTARTGGSGTANQGYAGGNSLVGSSSNRPNGGGGGAGSAGANGTTGVSGNGGNGVSSSITGTAVIRAGGGGGGIGVAGTAAGNGGTGGGGQGAFDGVRPATAGQVNSGSGGGGDYNLNATGRGAGGSGVVIVRYSA